MGNYTMQLRTVIDYYGRAEVENWFKDYNINEFLTAEQIEVIEDAGIWNKDRLARKIVDHYFMREIGFETPALFKHYAKTTMQEIMEEKFPLIYTISIKYDPLVNVDFTETFDRNASGTNNSTGTSNATGTSNGSSNSSTSSSSSSLGIDNQTPQTNITKQSLESGIYASSVGQNDSSASGTDNTTTTNTQSSLANSSSNNTTSSLEHYSRTQKGNSGVSATAQKMIEQFRDNIRAVDKEIIEELNSLFMGIY